MTLYNRQNELDLAIPDQVTIIGVGGVGSWVALDLALAGVPNIAVVDPDHVEEHNRNRTPFKTTSTGLNKAAAVAGLILDCRPDTHVEVHSKRVEDVNAAFVRDWETVIDCRDTAAPLPDAVPVPVIATGYDGFEITLHTNPDPDSVWGDVDTQYETVPSFVAPAQRIAADVCLYVCTGAGSGEHVTTFDMQDDVAGRTGEQA